MFCPARKHAVYLFLTVLLAYSLILNLLVCKSDCPACTVDQLASVRRDKPTIYLITPTYDRYEQLAELTRLSQTLLLVSKLHWIIVEDSPSKTDKIKRFIDDLVFKKKPKFSSDIRVLHLNVQTPTKYKIKPDQPNWSKPKGIWQRNLALEHLTTNFAVLDPNGVIYFLDDDNAYDVQIFEEMRDTQRVSVWPVGLAGQLPVEKPILNEFNQVIGFNSVWKPERRYPLDMAGFAVRLSYYIQRSSPKFYPNLAIGYQESYLLSQLLDDYGQFEPKADNCSQVYVWHTQAAKFKVSRKVKKDYVRNSVN